MFPALLGIGIGTGILIALSAFWKPTAPAAHRPEIPTLDIPWLSTWQIPAAIAAAGIGWAVTGWAPLGITLATLVLVAPALGNTSSSESDFAARTEAVASWTETLRDTMRGSRGIEAAIRVTGDNAPVAIRPALQRMNRRISMGVPLPDAMADCANDINSPVFDLVAAVLLNALSVSAAQVPDMLDDIAVQARERAHSHLQVHTSRSKQRTQLRLVAIIVIVTIFGFIAVFGSYLAPLASPEGQTILSFAAACVGGLLLWIASLSALPPMTRMLDPRRALTSRNAATEVGA